MLNWNMGGRGRVPQGDMNLANMSDSHLVALGQQGNASHAQLLEKCRMPNRVCLMWLNAII